MSFDKIGPYDLTRGDLVVAALVISFSTGARAVRIRAAISVLICLMVSVSGWLSRTPEVVVFGGFLLLLIFFIAPAFRSLKGAREIYLECSAEGLVAETSRVRTTYKWSTLQKVKKVGARLFVMISDGCALVIPDRSTSDANLRALMATIVDHRQSADA